MRRKKNWSLVALGVLSGFFVYGQDKLVKPMDIDLHASGNFGELRGTHFHAGLDLKTQQRTGIPVKATQDGYVSRIKVSTWGYGKVIYIAHTDGTTSVYAHLDRFQGDIAQYVLKNHYSKKAFEIEMFPGKGELVVKKGQVIALSGNTGGSGGPHLHYELRDSNTQEVLNPFSMGLDAHLTDTQAPTVNSLRVYTFNTQGALESGDLAQDLVYRKSDQGYIISDTVRAKGKIAFGIDAHDTANFNTNKNGVYHLKAFNDGKLVFSYKFDRFSFSQSNLVSGLLDYPLYVNTSKKVQKLFYGKPYNLSVITTDNSKGVVDVKPGDNFEYIIELIDYHGNVQKVCIPVVYNGNLQITNKEVLQSPYPIVTNKAYNYQKDFVKIQIPSETFYEDFYLDLKTKDGVFSLHNPDVYARKNITVSFDISDLDIQNPSKAFIGRVDKKGNRSFYKTSKKGQTWQINTKNLGDYKIMWDTTKPTIWAASFKPGDWLSNATQISFKVKDDLSGIQSIKATLNGNWILMDYDYKTQKIVHHFSDQKTVSGKNEIVVTVEDQMGNTQEFITHFFRK
ncbi:M23 family metallopeptidase [Myroides sp. LJL110]